jgi:hypothetical protein
VDLVATLPDPNESRDAVPVIDDDSAVVLWTGIDPRIHGDIADALDAAGIEYFDDGTSSPLMAAMRDDIEEIRVRGADLQKAKEVIAKLWGDADERDDAGEQETHIPTNAPGGVNPLKIDQPVFNRAETEADDADAAELPAEDDEGEFEEYQENFDPGEATATAWTGKDVRMAKIFEECLSNIGMGCVIHDENGSVTVSVMPAAEKRAKEVIREIEEAKPME